MAEPVHTVLPASPWRLAHAVRTGHLANLAAAWTAARTLPQPAGGVEWLATPLDLPSAEVEAAAALLADNERQRAARFACARDRDRYTVGRAWLRRLLAARLGVPPREVELISGAYGKPMLAPRFAAAALHFNLSRSQDLAVCAIAVGRKVGIDVERVWPAATATTLDARFFSPREQAAYRALREEDKAQGFFNCWTRKEAFVKALGVGLSLPLESFDVSLAPTEPARLLRVGSTDGERCGWRLHAIVPADGYVGAIVVAEPHNDAEAHADASASASTNTNADADSRRLLTFASEAVPT